MALGAGCAAYTGDSGELAGGSTGAPAPTTGEPGCAGPRCYASTLRATEAGVFAFDDQDGDGRLDMLVGLSRGFGVARGDGAGGFGPVVVLGEPTPYPAEAVVGGDFDCDGVRDVAALIRGQGALALARGGPDRAETLYSAVPRGSQIAVADFDGDGCDDAAVTADGVLRALLGDPSGHLRAAPLIGVGVAPSDLAAGDLDGDGDADLVVTNFDGHDLSLVLGDGAGGFAPQRVIAVGERPSDVELADLDGDGARDLLVVVARGLQVLRGRGGGDFEPPRSYAIRDPETTAPSRRGLAICALDGDAVPDLALGWRGPDDELLGLLGGPEGRFVDLVVLRSGDAVFNLECRDLDGDGDDDLLYFVLTVTSEGARPLLRLLLAEGP